MDPLIIIVGGLVAALVLFALALGAWHPRSGQQIVGQSLRNEGAEAEIEAHDIDQMLDALNERRRRAGRPETSDRLARELDPHLRDSSQLPES